ncbi:GGDEF domain-containing protein [Butyrivibrio sp. XPD2006]|uniref:GGDEF domain-containing protein n=1 Tax=Butyrivibrio sp. XPD2006 TaxID=1280668 RepID=UPI0003B43C81|nr:GGDEF domain-containing protein [Butyrivibrio sp. XPD2006]
MKDVSFYDIVISKKDQKIVSADSWIYDQLGNYAVKPMNELIAVEDMDIYLNNIKNCDGNWYPSKFLCPHTMYYTYMKAVRENEDFIRLTIVDAADLLNAHSSLMRVINIFQAQLDMYEDVYFVFTPGEESVSVFNTEVSDFQTKLYSLSEFEHILLSRAVGDQIDSVKSFITQVKSCVGRSTTTVKGNLLNNDPDVSHTILDESFVFYDQETKGVVGHIQLLRNQGAVKINSIKHDSMTGLLEKSDILRIAKERIDERRLEGTALAIIDIDFFKTVNDTFGHQFGDEVVKRIASIISNEVGTDGISGRFGGDEFLVVLYDIESEKELRAKLKGIKNKVTATFPDKGIDKDNPLSVSIGAAVFPKDAENYDELFEITDHCLYLAKEKGRNRYIIYTPEKHGTLEEIRHKQKNTRKINERDLSYGDVIVKMFNMALHDKASTIEQYMSEFAEAFGLQNVMLFVGEPFKHRYSAGSDAINDKVATDFVVKILDSPELEQYFALDDFVVINRPETLPPFAHKIKEFLDKRETYSIIYIRFFDKDNRKCIFIISTVGKTILWNQTHFRYYRAFIDLLSLHSLG